MVDPGPIYFKDDVPYNYIVVIDSGSSGSRVHIYNYPGGEDKTKNSPRGSEGNESYPFPHVSKLGNKWHKKEKPGIDTFAEDYKKVGKEHLKDLLKYAAKVVPKEQQPRTPVFLHATAGMRLLDDKQQKNILESACKYFRDESHFWIPDCETHFTVIDGEAEGLFGWLGLNYLIGGIDDPEAHDHGKNHSTYGFLDMGGASTQITFIPNATEIAENKQKLYDMRLRSLDGKQDRDFEIYSQTFLGMGANEARKKYLESLKEEDGKLRDPCIPKGFKAKKKVDDDDDGDDKKHKQHVPENLEGEGNFDKCMEGIKPLLDDIIKHDKPDFDFDVNHFVGVSGYWDSTDAFQLGGDLNLETFSEKIKSFCNGDWNELVKSKEYDMKEEKLEKLCFESSWLLGVTNDGFQFPRNTESSKDADLSSFLRPLQAAEEINGVEFSWTLGRALLYASSELGATEGESGIQAPGTDSWLYGRDTSSRPGIHEVKVPHDDKHDDDDDDGWGDLDDLLDKKSHRLWGSLLFLGILIVIVWLMLGKIRRRQIWHSIKGRMTSRQRPGQYTRVETETASSAAQHAEEFELGDVDDQFNVDTDEEEELPPHGDASNKV